MEQFVVLGIIQGEEVVHGPFPDRLKALAWAQAREEKIRREFPEFKHSFRVKDLWEPHPN